MGEMRVVTVLVEMKTGNGVRPPGSTAKLPKHTADLMIERGEAVPYPLEEEAEKPRRGRPRKNKAMHVKATEK